MPSDIDIQELKRLHAAATAVRTNEAWQYFDEELAFHKAMFLAFPALIARLERAEAERDALAARVAELDGVMSAYFNGYMLDEAEDEDICVDGERQHLRARAVGDALARTPAQSLASCKAAALREAAGEMQEVTDSIVWCEAELQGRQAIIDRVSEMAERLEAEAANGPQ